MNNNWRSGGGSILSHVLKVTELEFDPCWNFRDKAQGFQTYSKRACPANDNWENHLDKCVALYCAGCYSLWPSPLPPNSCLPFSAVPRAKGLTPLGFPYPLAAAWTQSTRGPIKRPADGKRERISPPHPPSPCFHTMSVTIAEYFFTTVSSTNLARTGSSKHHTLSLPLRPWVVLIYPAACVLDGSTFLLFSLNSAHTLVKSHKIKFSAIRTFWVKLASYQDPD